MSFIEFISSAQSFLIILMLLFLAVEWHMRKKYISLRKKTDERFIKALSDARDNFDYAKRSYEDTLDDRNNFIKTLYEIKDEVSKNVEEYRKLKKE